MGCMCCSLASFVSIVLHSLERISLCTVCAMLTCCLLFTIMSVLMLGIGIGYHYCFVQNSVDAMAKAAKAAGSMRSNEGPMNGGVMRSLDKVSRRGFAHRVARRDADPDPPLTNRKTTNASFNKNFPATNGTNVSQHRMARRETNHFPSLPNRNIDYSFKNISMDHRIVRREANSYLPLFIENTADDSLNTKIPTTNVTNFSRHRVTLHEANPLPPLFKQDIDLSFKNMTSFTDSNKERVVWREANPIPQNATIISFNKIISYMSNFTIFT